jgi:hypothetical protein
MDIEEHMDQEVVIWSMGDNRKISPEHLDFLSQVYPKRCLLPLPHLALGSEH